MPFNSTDIILCQILLKVMKHLLLKKSMFWIGTVMAEDKEGWRLQAVITISQTLPNTYYSFIDEFEILTHENEKYLTS